MSKLTGDIFEQGDLPGMWNYYGELLSWLVQASMCHIIMQFATHPRIVILYRTARDSE